MHPNQDSLTAWDSHAMNDQLQSNLFETLFADLSDLMALLELTPGPDGGALSERTVVVVLSEMGRTPGLNSTLGKDHWPFSSMLVSGPGITGDRVIGGFDELQYGLAVDLESGELSQGGATLGVDNVGATLLELAGIDPASTGLLATPLRGALS